MNECFQRWTISVHTFAYVREYCIKVASYTRFHLKHIHISNSSQVKLKVRLDVTSNTALVLILHMCKFWVVQTGGDSNDKPTAMQSRSMARSQCWTTVSKRTILLSAPYVSTTGNNQPWKKPAMRSRPASVLTIQDFTPNQYTTWLA